jgi:hypothetical protein
LQIRGVDYIISGSTITFINVPQTGDYLRAWYRVEDTVLGPTTGGLYRDDVVQLIMDRLGMRTGLETLIIRHMQHVQAMLESRQTLPWFLVRSVDISTTSKNVAIPYDMIREVDDVDAMWLVRSDGRQTALPKFDYDALATSEAYAGSGNPRAYALYGTNFYFFPAPDGVKNFKLLYYGFDKPLSSNIKNNWLIYATKLVIAETGLSVARTLRDLDQAAIFLNEAKEAWLELVRSNTARLMAGLRSSVGDYTA